MRIPKKYGDTSPKCTFCDNIATTKNSSGVQVCKHCKDKQQEVSCPACGKPMDAKDGKFGPYFHCWKCQRNWNPNKVKAFQK